ncbi:MAG TPA: ABC transporter substrate-binding protein [Candidatus Limnocylindria bacterium]|nr:ABC transporter substrate-binding protein [Candidatus Limnocylindria bacterium]
MNPRHWSLFVLSLIVALNWAQTSSAAEPKLLNVGWTGGTAWTALPDRVAMERGFFEKEGLRPRYVQFQGTNLMLSALMANELDYVTILPFIAGAATRGLPVKIVATTVKTSGYAIISRPDIDSVKALKGKRIAINTFGSSADFAIYQLLSRNGLDPNKDVTLQAIAGSPDARFAALLSGAVDATVVNSPFEYRAEQRGFKTLLSVKETAEFVKIPIVGLSTTQRKIDREPDEIVRYLRALRNAILFLQSQREAGVSLIEKLLKLDRPVAERFYGIYRDQYNPDLSVPDSVVEEWIAVGTFRAKEKIIAKPSVVVDWSFAEKARTSQR